MVGLHKVQAEAIKFKDARVKAEESVAQAQEKAAEKSMVGLHGLQAQAVKFADEKRARDEQDAAFREKMYAKAEADEHGRQRKEAQARQKAADDDAAYREKTYAKAESDEHNRQRKAAEAKQKQGEQDEAFREKTFAKAEADEHNRQRRTAQQQQRLDQQNAEFREKTYAKADADEHARQRKAAMRQQRLDDENAKYRQKVYDRVLAREHDRQVQEAQQQQQAQQDAAAANLKVGLAALASAALAAATAVDTMGRNAMEAANRVVETDRRLAELATMMGRPGELQRTQAELKQFRARTFQTAPAAEALFTKFYEAAQSSVGTKISPAGVRQLLEGVGKYQAVFGGDAGTMGDLAAQLVNQSKGPVNVTDATRDFLQIQRTFQATRGNVAQLNQQYARNASYYKDTLFDPKDAAAYLAAFSMTDPTGAGESMVHFIRATSGSLDRNRGMGVEGAERMGMYTKRLGAKAGVQLDQLQSPQIAELIFKDFDEQARKAAAVGKKFNPYTYLMHHGYANQQDIKALQDIYSVRNNQTLDTFMGTVHGAIPPEFVQKPTQRFLAAEPVARANVADLMKDMADLSLGGGETANFYEAKKAAYQKVRGESWFGNLIPQDYKDFSIVPSGIGEWLTSGFTLPAKAYLASAVDSQQGEEMNQARARVGLPDRWFRLEQLTNFLSNRNPFGAGDRPTSMADLYSSSQKEVLAAGGMGGIDTGPLEQGNQRIVDKLDEIKSAILGGRGNPATPTPRAVRPGPALGAGSSW